MHDLNDKWMSNTRNVCHEWVKRKKENTNEVIFVKRGKFMEFFHDDADLFHLYFGAPYMGGFEAHNGIPISRSTHYANQLGIRGYKVYVLIESAIV
jgi:DNA mismatch repair ATPase MutS